MITECERWHDEVVGLLNDTSDNISKSADITSVVNEFFHNQYEDAKDDIEISFDSLASRKEASDMKAVRIIKNSAYKTFVLLKQKRSNEFWDVFGSKIEKIINSADQTAVSDAKFELFEDIRYFCTNHSRIKELEKQKTINAMNVFESEKVIHRKTLRVFFEIQYRILVFLIYRLMSFPHSVRTLSIISVKKR